MPRLVLVGPPGSGKTSPGAALAQRLGVSLHDTDAAVEAAEGRSISDIFVVDGEATFRELERAGRRVERRAGQRLPRPGGRGRAPGPAAVVRRGVGARADVGRRFGREGGSGAGGAARRAGGSGRAPAAPGPPSASSAASPAGGTAG